jgi:putative sigma-54 modulation protein
MNITYTGKQEHLHPNQKANIDSKFGKIAKLLDIDGKGEKQAHVILAHNKNQYRAEITLNYLDHALVGEHTDPDQFTAINVALEKLEKRILKVREKRRNVKKGPREGWDKGAAANTIIAAEPTNPEGIAAANGKRKVFRVEPVDGKPMTLEEAMLVIDDEDYLVYRETKSNRVSVLLRRDDGNFDLVEC